MKSNKTTPTVNSMCLVVIGAPQKIAAFNLEAAKTLPFLKPSIVDGWGIDPESKCDPMEKRHREAESESKQCWGFDWKTLSKYMGEERPDILAFEFDTAASLPISHIKQLSKSHPRLFFHISSLVLNSALGVMQQSEHYFFNGMLRENSRSTPIISLPGHRIILAALTKGGDSFSRTRTNC